MSEANNKVLRRCPKFISDTASRGPYYSSRITRFAQPSKSLILNTACGSYIHLTTEAYYLIILIYVGEDVKERKFAKLTFKFIDTIAV